MDRNEFITNLQRHLTGKVSVEKLKELTGYYCDYIDAEIRKGKSEEEVLDSLGDPRLLAKTIVETEGNDNYHNYSQTVYEDGNEEEGGRKRGFHINIKGWLFWLVAILILCLVFYVVFGIVGLALNIFFRYVLPVAIPLLIIYAIIQMIKR